MAKSKVKKRNNFENIESKSKTLIRIHFSDQFFSGYPKGKILPYQRVIPHAENVTFYNLSLSSCRQGDIPKVSLHYCHGFLNIWVYSYGAEWTQLARLLSKYLKQEILKNVSKAYSYAFRLVIFQKPWVSAFWILASPAYFSKKNLIKRKILNTLETLYLTLKNWKPLPGSTRL